MKATDKTGKLIPLSDCYITSDLDGSNLYSASGSGLVMDNLPDISDGKTASYTPETGIGRSAPYKNYANSEERAISMDVHMFVQSESGGQSAKVILDTIRWLEAHVYPMEEQSTTYAPPPIMKVKCFSLLAEDELCCVLKSYSVKFDPSVPWDEKTGIPYKVDISLSLEVAYPSADLPYAEDIMDNGG